MFAAEVSVAQKMYGKYRKEGMKHWLFLFRGAWANGLWCVTVRLLGEFFFILFLLAIPCLGRSSKVEQKDYERVKSLCAIERAFTKSLQVLCI